MAKNWTAIFIFYSNNIFQTKNPLEQKLRQNGDPDLLKLFHSDIKHGHALNSHLWILQTISSSKPYVLLSRNQATWRLRINWIISFRYQRWPRTKQQSWNSSNNISFQPICPHEQKLDWMGQVKKRPRNAPSFHSDTKDGHALNSLLGNFQTTSSNLYIILSRNLLGCIMQHWDSE